MPISLDAIDRKLINELEQDADRTNVELAQVIGLSPAATLNRVKKLKDAGVIRAIRADIDPAAAGLTLQVYVSVVLHRHDDAAYARFRRVVAETPQIVSADEVTGETDALLRIVTRDVAELQRVLASLATKGGAGRILTLLRLSELKARQPLPFSEA